MSNIRKDSPNRPTKADVSTPLSIFGSSNEEPHIDFMPDEVLCHIFSYSTCTEKGKIGQSCKRWKALVWASLRCLDIIRLESINKSVLSQFTEMCQQLITLRINGCFNVRDECMDAITQMKHLKHLHLNYCDWLTDASLNVLKTSSSIQDLSIIANCRITSNGIANLCKLPLTSLNISACRGLDSLTILYISQMTYLSSLDISDTSFQLAPEDNFSYLKNLSGFLTNLSVRRTVINDESLKIIGELTKLTSLDLSENHHITNNGIAHTGQLTKLKRLYLSQCRSVNDEALPVIANMTDLEHLEIQFTGIVKEGIENLTNLNKLLTFIASKAIGSFPVLNTISKFSRIYHLCLTDFKFDTEDVPLLGNLTNLGKLDISLSSGINDSVLTHIAKLSQLVFLNLSGTTISSAGLYHLAPLARLQTLVMDWCPMVGDSVGYVLQTYPSLTSLSLQSCKSISDKSVPELFKISKLCILNLKYCGRITSKYDYTKSKPRKLQLRI